MKGNSSPSVSDEPSQPGRRDFLFVATVAAGTAGEIAAVFPLVDQLNPDASTLAAGAPVDFDLGKMQPGQQVVVTWSPMQTTGIVL